MKSNFIFFLFASIDSKVEEVILLGRSLVERRVELGIIWERYNCWAISWGWYEKTI